ncbi:hypothetical protein BKA70DRAFT_1215205 [Coprinopsis sp. MPI-PUGE-AT-0042]|nr:hypothetical protein BKA70DRAFT_1215205 [Coprinopsis sp. MPI-PUGE-AT-0042]
MCGIRAAVVLVILIAWQADWCAGSRGAGRRSGRPVRKTHWSHCANARSGRGSVGEDIRMSIPVGKVKAVIDSPRPALVWRQTKDRDLRREVRSGFGRISSFFTELASTATQAWAWSNFVAPQYTCKADLVPVKPKPHDLSFQLERAVSYSPSTPAAAASVASATRPRPAIHMPLELVLLIIEASYEGGQPDTAVLKACSLVCREWSAATQKLLFRNATLDTRQAFESFTKAVAPSTERGELLGGAVRELKVVLDYSHPAPLSQHALGRVVTMCPNLQELDISVYGQIVPGEDEQSRHRRPAPSFDGHTLALLRSGPQIQSLSFNNSTDNQECLFQLLDVWPSLQKLSIGGTTPQLPREAVLPYPAKLEALQMNFQTPPSMEFMNWLLHHSTGTLRNVTFERDPCPEFVDVLVESSTLRSLSVPSSASTELAKRFEHIQRSNRGGEGLQLEFLRMDQPKINPLMFKALPTSIKHLAFGVDRDTPLQPVIELVKTRSALGEITIRLFHGGEAHRLLPALKIACAYRGVDLRIETDAKMYESLLA